MHSAPGGIEVVPIEDPGEGWQGRGCGLWCGPWHSRLWISGSIGGVGGRDGSLALTCPCPSSVKRAQVLDAEGLTLGSVIVTSKKARRDLIDDSFNRYLGQQ